jgi:uncharacterized protein YdaU (DUF1376 family)
MPWYLDRVATDHLGPEEFGALVLLLVGMWRRWGWLPADPEALARICRVPRTRWDALWPALASNFQTDGARLTSAAMLVELARAQARHQRAVANGRLGGLARAANEQRRWVRTLFNDQDHGQQHHAKEHHQ